MAPRVLVVDDNAELLGLVARVLDDAGYEVVAAQRARTALEKIRTDRPDVAVVDILLPDQMGYEVATALRTLKIPFFLMSGVFKGGKQGMEAVQKHGAVEFVEKPFVLDLLVEKIARLVPPAPSSVPFENVDTSAPDNVEEAETTGGIAVELTGRVRLTETSGRVSATLSGDPVRIVTPRGRPPEASRAPSSPPPVLAQHFPITDTRGLLTPLEPTPGPNTKPMPAPTSTSGDGASRSGELRDNLPNLINAFFVAQETGELVCQRGQVRKTVFFEKGAPVFAGSNLSSDRFGQFLVRIGKVPPDDLKAATLVAERTKRRTGDVLIDMGLITDTERMYFVGQQVKAIIYSLFAWEDGVWHLTFSRKGRLEALKLDLHPANLIMRGVRKLYRKERLEKLMPDHVRPIPGPDPAYQLSDVELEGWEAMLISRINGTRDVAELVRLAQRPPEQVRGLLVGLLYLRIVDYAR